MIAKFVHINGPFSNFKNNCVKLLSSKVSFKQHNVLIDEFVNFPYQNLYER